MKISKLLHIGSVIAGFWGFLALIGVWLAGENGFETIPKTLRREFH